MADFVAEIQAKLNLSNIEKQLNNLKTTSITLNNVTVDTSKLKSQIQNAINSSYKINVDLGKSLGSSVAQSGAKLGSQLGTQVGKQYANTLANSLNNIHLKNGSIGNINQMLQGAGFDTKSINNITNGLDKMVLSVNKLSTSNLKNGSLKMNISGVDELGRSVQIIREFDKTTGKVLNTKKSFTQSFDSSVEAAKRLQTELKAVANIQKQLSTGSIDSAISGVTAKYDKASSTGHSKLSEIKSGLEELSILQNSMSNSTDNKTLIANYEKYNDTLAKVKNNLSIVASENSAIPKMASGSRAVSFNNKLETWLDKNTKKTNTFRSEVKGIQEEFQTLYSSGKLSDTKLGSLQEQFLNADSGMRRNGVNGKSITDRLKGAATSLVNYVGVSTAIYQAVNGLKDMFNNVVQIDSAMTELKKITNETTATYANFQTQAGTTAKEIGTTISDYINSTADFARLGYSFTDSQELAKTANVYAVVGDEIASVDDATQSIVSTMTAYKDEVTDSMQIADKFNEVGNNYAISSGGLGEALQRSASSMAAANNSLDESIALITAANTVVQDPETVGNAFKTVSMRIRGATTELEEAGESTEGMAESTATLRDEIKALAGVDIMENDNTFKSTYDILDELSQKWDSLSDISQATIIERIAGKHRGNVIQSLMSNFDIARDALVTSETSDGSAMKEHSTWMESLEAKIKQLQATWQDFSQTVISSDFAKGLVDSGTTILSVFTKLVDTFGVLNTLVGGFAIFKTIKSLA